MDSGRKEERRTKETDTKKINEKRKERFV